MMIQLYLNMNTKITTGLSAMDEPGQWSRSRSWCGTIMFFSVLRWGSLKVRAIKANFFLYVLNHGKREARSFVTWIVLEWLVCLQHCWHKHYFWLNSHLRLINYYLYDHLSQNFRLRHSECFDTVSLKPLEFRLSTEIL